MKKAILLSLSLSAILLGSCSKKAETKDIIVPPPTEEVKKGTQTMPETHQDRDIEWLGSSYKIIISRNPNKDLPKVSDEMGTDYYDNEISLRIQRHDGSDFMNRTFHKSDFNSKISGTGFEKSGALLGIVFDKVENNKLIFAASVGSPEISSDEFVPITMTINRDGQVNMTLDTHMDTNVEDEGV